MQVPVLEVPELASRAVADVGRADERVHVVVGPGRVVLVEVAVVVALREGAADEGLVAMPLRLQRPS